VKLGWYEYILLGVREAIVDEKIFSASGCFDADEQFGGRLRR
jgi:hypothetical protein